MMSNTKKITCDCGNTNPKKLNYFPIASEVKAELYFCKNCNSIFTYQKNNKIKTRKQRISCDANWGNIRHGKGARLNNNINFFESLVPENSFLDTLDIGSNRGHFIKWLIKNKKIKNLYAIESDSRVFKETKLPSKVIYKNIRFESYKAEKNKYSFIYNSHTLEHFKSPFSMLKKCFEILKENGFMFLEVPNSEVIKNKDNVEEYFIDKHHYHFFYDGLLYKIKEIGFEVIKDDNNNYNLTFLLKKNLNKNHKSLRKKIYNFKECAKAIKNYERMLISNRKKLKEKCRKINALCSKQKVAIWGCSRIFDASIQYGGLNVNNIQFLIDNNINNILKSVEGLNIYDKAILHEKDIDAVIVMARSSKKEIINNARDFGIRHVFSIDQF